MKVEWDPQKAKDNIDRHGIHFSDAEPVLFDPYALTREDTDSEDEERYLSVGMDALLRILVVVYTYRDENIRLISARPATRKERKAYERGIRL